MTTLKEKIQSLRSEATECCTRSTLLEAFDLDMCERIDRLSEKDSFIEKKKKSVLSCLSELGIDYDDKWKSAVDYYNEVGTYIHLKYKKKINIERVPKGPGNIPDFRFKLGDTSYYIELKTLHFTAGGLNYRQTLNDGLNASIDLEDQRRRGRKVAVAETVVAPLYRQNKQYDTWSVKYYIETIIEKIKQNIKSEQFKTGDTFLLVDLKLVSHLSTWKEASIAIYQEQQYKSMVSGELWNVAFGKRGQPVFQAIEFEGKENVEGGLEANGILIDHNEVKGLCFQSYKTDGSRKIVGFYRHCDTDCLAEPLFAFCDFTNDDCNSNAWKVLQNEL